MSDIEEYISQLLDKLPDAGSCEDALQELDSMLGQLCILSNELNLQMSNSSNSPQKKTFYSKTTQKSIIKVWRVPTVDDSVFGKFIELQDNFQYNISAQIVQLLSKDLSDNLLISLNQVLQGCLLLHPPSRNLFKRKSNMLLLLSYLEEYESHSLKLIITIIQSLVCLMVKNVPNLRIFETLNGPQLICQIFTTTSEKKIKHKALEFLMFYLIPEREIPLEKLFANHGVDGSNNSTIITTQLNLITLSSDKSKDGYERKTMEQKLQVLKPYLDNVDELINQLIEIKPFGKMRYINW